MSYHRLIGGPHDGEWHEVRRDAGLFLPPIWTVAQRATRRFSFEPMDEPSINLHTHYKPFPLRCGGLEVVTFYVEHSMRPEDVLMALAEGYRTPSRPVMNPPAQAEAGNRIHAAPGQADRDAACRGETGLSPRPEARPVMPTAHSSGLPQTDQTEAK